MKKEEISKAVKDAIEVKKTIKNGKEVETYTIINNSGEVAGVISVTKTPKK